MNFQIIKDHVKIFFRNLVMKERSPQAFAFAFSVGVYIGFSPFPGFHTAMVLAVSWLWGLSMPVVFAASCLINSPWTMVPVYAADYVVGDWVCSGLCGFDMLGTNPAWMSGFNTWLSYYTGFQGVSLYSFLIGGNLLGIGAALALYPIMRYVFSMVARGITTQSNKEISV